MSILQTTRRIGAAAAGSVTLAREAQRLDTWKEIAAYFGRSTRCVQRWELKEGLPVHRHEHSRRSSIFALRTELDAWQASRMQKRNALPEKVSTRKNLGFVAMSGKAAKHFRLGSTDWTW
jgi:hypothetical protein